MARPRRTTTSSRSAGDYRHDAARHPAHTGGSP